MRLLFLIGCIVLINLEAFSQQNKFTIITEESTDLKNWNAVSSNTFISINTNYEYHFRIKSVLLSTTQSLQNFSTTIERTIGMNNWTPCAENSFPVANPSCFYRLKTISDVLPPKSFSYSLAAPGEGNENGALFPDPSSPGFPDSYEAIFLTKINTSSGNESGIPLLNPVLFFDPIAGATFDEGGVVNIRLNGIGLANFEFNKKYCGKSFAIRLYDTGQILAFDSLGQELRFPLGFEFGAIGAVYYFIAP
jgi:hypothetical protein